MQIFNKKQEPSEGLENKVQPTNTAGVGIADFSSSVKSRSFAATKPMDTAVRSIIGRDVTITGNVVSKFDVLLEGHVEGDIHCGSLHVGDNASLIGDVVADEMTLHGDMKGSISCHDVFLKASARFEGDINCKSLAVEEGALFLGQSRPSDDPLTNVAKSESQTVQPAATGPAQHGFGTSKFKAHGHLE